MENLMCGKNSQTKIYRSELLFIDKITSPWLFHQRPPYLNFNLNYYWYTYKTVLFKIQQNCTMNEEFDFFEGGKERGHHFYINFNLNYYW